MYFTNETFNAVTKRDRDLLLQVCILLRALCFVRGKKIKENPKWRSPRLECHSISRLISLIQKDLTLVDGYLVGIDTADPDNAKVMHTCHSWLLTPDSAIIDPYPMGLISTTTALLMPTSGTRYCAHGASLYHESPNVRKYFNVKKCWRKANSYFRVLKGNILEEDMKEIGRELL